MRDGENNSTPGSVLGGQDEILRLIVDSATDYAIFTTNTDGRILTWSAGAQAIFGYTPEEAIGQPAAIIFTAEDRAAGAPAEEVETARRQGCAPDERWHVRKDGSLVFMNGSMRPLLAGGRERGFLKVARDDTGSRRTATALAASEARFRALADNIAQLAWITDPEGSIVWYNRRWYDYTGTTFDEMQGWGWRAVHHPDHVERVVKRFSRALAAREPWEDTFPLRSADGRYRWFLSRAQPIYDEAGALTGWFGTNTDVTELRETTAALRESEEHYRSTVELNPQVTWTSAPDGQLDRVSQRWFDWTGTTGLGASWGAVIHPDDLQRTVDVWTRAFTTGEPYAIEHRVRLRSGEHHWMRSRAFARRDEQGRIVRWYGTTEDIHEQKSAEAALRESEMRLRAITDSIDQMIWSTRPDGFHDYFNQRWYDYTGMPAGSTDGEEWNGMFHPDDQERAWERWRRSLATGEPYEIEYRLRHRSGEYRWVLGRALPVRSEEGEILRWFGTCTDIDDQVRAREMLSAYRSELERQVEERTRERDRIWNMSQDLFAIAGFDGMLKAINPAWKRLLGYDEAFLLSTPFIELIHPDDHAAAAEVVGRLQQGTVVQSFEDRLRRADGSYATVAWTASSEGEQFSAVGRDVTAEREREEQLRQAQKMEAVGQLTGGVAHDFNNLLQIVVGNLEILQRNLPPDAPRLHRSTQNAMEGARRAVTLTQRLLAFSRRQPLAPKPLEPNKLVRGMSELLARALDETIALETVLAAGLWRVEADPNQLEAAILNLAVNARDAMPDGGKLTIETSNTHLDQGYAQQNVEVAPGQYVVICVSDTGAGMDKAAADRAFEPFFTTKEVGKGTGLGLSQVYGFVKQSGGHVKIYSEVGEGTTVKLYLPRYTGSAAEEQEADAAAAPEGAETILVVEDDEDVRSYTVEVLRELGYRVLEAANGPGALRILALPDTRVDLLFTDVVLPGGLNGEQLALQALDRWPGLKVLFTTGYARNAIVHQGRLDPGVQLITKPFSYTELAGRVRDVLDARQSS